MHRGGHKTMIGGFNSFLRACFGRITLSAFDIYVYEFVRMFTQLLHKLKYI